jgi:hypothetical protein
MAKRVVSTTVCANCLDEFITKEMYTVVRKMHRGVPEDKGEYYAPYCEECIKDTDFYLRILKSPGDDKKKK